MSSWSKVPFTRRRVGFNIFDSDDEDDSPSASFDNRKEEPQDVAGTSREADSDSDTDTSGSDDVPDGKIRMPNKEKLFLTQDDNVFLEETQTYPEDLEHSISSYGSEQSGSLSTEELKKVKSNNFVYEFGWFQMILGVVSIAMFFLDIGTDIALVVEYFLEKEAVYAVVTLILTAVPSLLTCGLGLYWYILEYKQEQKQLEKKAERGPQKLEEAMKYKTSNCQWMLRFIMTILQLGPVIRVAEYLYFGHKSSKASDEEKVRLHKRMLFEDVDACLLRLFECFLEAAPQLTWQLFVWIHLKEEEKDVIQLSIRILGLLSSWVSLALSLMTYQRAMRFSQKMQNNKEIMRKRAAPFYFIWRASEVGNRVLCISFFASSFHNIVFIPLLVHWLAMSMWLMCRKTKFYENDRDEYQDNTDHHKHDSRNKHNDKCNRCNEIIFNIICGYVMIFCFLNLKEGYSRLKYVLYYFLFYTENFAMLAVWFIYPSHIGDWFLVGGFTLVAVLTGMHIFFQLFYYFQCHPRKRDIKVCLPEPCNKNTWFELLCHELEENEEQQEPMNTRTS